MKKKSFFLQRVYPVSFMFVLTAILIGALGWINAVTKEQVALNEKLSLIKAVLTAAGMNSGTDAEAAAKAYGRFIEEIKDDKGLIQSFIVKDSDGRQTGTVVFSRGPGLWGEIEAVIGLAADGKTITGIDFTKQNETPGLGARITESWFRDQFKDKQGPFRLVAEGEAKGNDGVDAVTGASWTSRYAVDIINLATGN